VADAPFPIVILDLQKIVAETIAAVKVDANADFVADRVGETVFVKGVVTTPDLNLSSTSGNSFYIQDETGGINIYSKPKLTPFFVVGDLVQVKGVVTMYNGLTELVVTSADTNIIKLGKGTVPTPKVITVEELMAHGEDYESTLITINALAKTATSAAWPVAGKDANMNVWDGYKNFTMRIDKDFDLAGQPEPVYPMNVTGVLLLNIVQLLLQITATSLCLVIILTLHKMYRLLLLLISILQPRQTVPLLKSQILTQL